MQLRTGYIPLFLRSRVLLAATVAMLLLLATGVACDSGIPASDLPSSMEILETSATAMDDVRSGHVHMDMEINSSVNGADVKVEVAVDGEFKSPDESKIRGTVTALNFDEEFDVVVTGGETYSKTSQTGVWNQEPDPIGMASTTHHVGKVNLHKAAQAAERFVVSGTEKASGEVAFRLTADLPFDIAAEVFSGVGVPLDEVDGDVAAELWIGVEDYLLRKMAIEFRTSSPDQGTSSRVRNEATYANFGVAVEIMAPTSLSGQTPVAASTPVLTPTSTPELSATVAPLGTLSILGVPEPSISNQPPVVALSPTPMPTFEPVPTAVPTVIRGDSVAPEGAEYQLPEAFLTATPILVGEPAIGKLETGDLRDIFVWRVESGKSYRVTLEVETPSDLVLGLVTFDGGIDFIFEELSGKLSTEINISSISAGDSYIMVFSPDEDTGPYTLSITETTS